MLHPFVCPLLFAYLVIVFGRIILSWFPIDAGSIMATVFGILYALTEPVLGPIRRVMPTMSAGGMGLDFSPIIVILGITVLRGIFC
ncbi:MAG: YggT family protein [Actinomycetota bacterium]|nr:YggT family protein [Actinomycetota bacterium]